MRDSYYFLSDVHLGLENREKEWKKESLLIEALHSIKNDAKELFIVGDLFDYWFEYKKVYQKGYFRTLSALHEITKAGIPVHYVIGNHDFMHRDFFEDVLNVKLYEDNIERKIDGKNFFIAHGDGLIKDDYLYNILKKILRNKKIQFLYSLLHPDFGIWFASGSSRKSRKSTVKYEKDPRDKLFEFSKKLIDNGTDYVIMGHTHKRAFEHYKKGYYINLGTWLKMPCLGRYRDGHFEFIEFSFTTDADTTK